jgi:hypothetical protein
MYVGRAYAGEETMFSRVSLTVNIYDDFDGTVNVLGPTWLGWSEPYYNGIDWVIDTEIISMDFYGDNDIIGPVTLRTDPMIPSSGQVVLDAGGDFPAESFFDVYTHLCIPGLFPGDTLRNLTPIQISATIDALPPFFDGYESFMVSPVILFNNGGIPVGEITVYSERSITYYEPKARIYVPTSKGSDIAIADEGWVAFGAGLSGHLLPSFGEPVPLPIEPLSAAFGIREEGDPGPFMNFYTDVDGSGTKLSTTGPLGEGDGWMGYLYIPPYPTSGGYYEVEVDFTIPWLGQLRDTIVTFIDPTPTIPEFMTIPSESIAIFEPDTVYDIVYTLFDEDAVNGELLAFKLEESKKRDLWGVCQYSLYNLGDTMDYACLPASAASCLQYFAENGYPELARESPKGGGGGGRRMTGRGVLGNSDFRFPADEGDPPEMDPNQMAEELAGAMGTSMSGTDARDGVNGLVDYLEDRGHDDWYVAYARVDDAEDIALMLEEYEVEGQDVLIIVYDTTAAKDDTTGHAMTLGSHSGGTGGVPDSIDFMDPKDGSSGDAHTYEVGYNGENRPTTNGYNLDGDGAATITGFIEISPPAEADGGRRLVADSGALSFRRGEWNLLDSGPASGNGMPDTLRWDTACFPEGTYLLVLRTTDATGDSGRSLRLARLWRSVTGAETPKIRTGLKSSYPNPFNPYTTIEFTLAAEASVSLSIYNVMGQLVRRLLVNEPRAAGVHRVEWHGVNDGGERVASGVYFCRFAAGDVRDVIKVILIR